MIVENISSDDTEFVSEVKLTLDETKAILHSLGRTMCKGEDLTISMELEDKLFEIVIKNYSND